MKYRLEISPIVHAEVAEIYLFYARDTESSGDRFLKALRQCYKDLLLRPYGYQIRKAPYRYAMLHHMKYRVVYTVVDDLVSIYQVRHNSRKPSKKYGP